MPSFLVPFKDTTSFGDFLGSKEFFDYSYPEPIRAGLPKPVHVKNMGPSTAIPADYLVAFSNQMHSYCVGCVDMVDSTKISASIPSYKLSAYYEIFLNSMSKIIGRFGGKVIKNVGDCLLYYFPGSENSSKNSDFTSCLDCGLAMLQARKLIGEQLLLQKLPNLSYRISADWGFALVMNTTDSPSIDLIGSPVNMCTKINHCAINNEFVIGGDLYQMVKKIHGYRFQQVQDFNVGFKHSYPVYKVASE